MLSLKGGAAQLLRKPKLLVIGGLIIALSIVGWFVVPKLVIKYQDYQALKTPITPIANDATARQNTIRDTQASLSKQDSAVPLADRLLDYDALVSAYAADEQYDKALQTFTEREQVSTQDLDYASYYVACGYAMQVKDKARATELIVLAESYIPAASDPEDGYLHEQLVNRVAERKQEIAQL